MIDYLALAASTIDCDFKKQTFVIGICRIPRGHNAENVKKAIEQIINWFTFDNVKLSSIVTDEGSNLLRLFKQLPGLS